MQLAPVHESSTTIAGAIALPGYEISYAAEAWSVQLIVLLPEVWPLPLAAALRENLAPSGHFLSQPR